MSRAKLAAAKELIEEKQYDAARVVLKTMRGDETAKAWLKKLPKKRRGWWKGIAVALVFFVGVGIGLSDSQARQPVATVPTQAVLAAPSLTFTRTPTANTGGTQVAAERETAMAALAITAQAANIGLTQAALAPPLPVAFDEADYVRQLSDGLFILAGGRDVSTIRVADGRAVGGERGVVITYRTTETSQAGYVDEVLDLFSAVAATIRADDLDVDSVTLIAGTPTGAATAILSSTIGDLLAFHRGEISGGEFFTRLSSADL